MATEVGTKDSSLRIARSELVLGGQKSGKTGRAESLAAAWLAADPRHRALYLATARAGDAEMAERIDRHRRERAGRVPGMRTVEEPQDIASVLRTQGDEATLVVVDCLTLWLAGWMLPPGEPPRSRPHADVLAEIFAARAGPLVLVSNEIGLGVIPMGRGTRAYVDALGSLNQQAARACERVTLMVAGLPLSLKGAP